MSRRGVALSVVCVVIVAAGFVAVGVAFDVSPGGVAAILAAVGFGAAMIGLLALLLTVMGVVRELTVTVKELTDTTVPLLKGVSETVSGVNTELARVDSIIASAQHVSARAEGVADLVHAAVSNPLIKLISFGAGSSAAVRAARRRRTP